MCELRKSKFSPRLKAIGHPNYNVVVRPQKPTQRELDRERNERNYRASTIEANKAFLEIATVAKTKLDLAIDGYWSNKRGWGDDVAANSAQLVSVTKERALFLRVAVVRAYLEMMLKTKNKQRLAKQQQLAESFRISSKLVALWTRDFIRSEPPPLHWPATTIQAPAAANPESPPQTQESRPIPREIPPPPSYRPFNFPPINPYTVPAHSKPHVNDERIRTQCHWFVRTNARVKGRPVLKADSFKKWVNSDVIPKMIPDHEPISLATAKRWLFDLGFRKKKISKTMYIDGHEREDVVKARAEFVREILRHAEYMSPYGTKIFLNTPLILDIFYV